MSNQLNVPYRSQWDPDAKDYETDCGPTSVSMILGAFGINLSSDEIYRRHLPSKRRDQYITFNELLAVLEKEGVPMVWKKYVGSGEALEQLKANINAGKPMIALVKYHPWRTMTGNQFSGGHFVVVVGYDNQHIYMNDPLFGNWVARSKGERFPVPVRQFLDAWGGFPETENPNFACSITTRSLTAAAAPPPPPQPVTPAPIGDTPAVTPDVRRRIMALAAMLRAMPPDLDLPEDVQFWTARLGDFGAQVAKHTVVSGNTLGGLAGRFYGDMSKWRGIQSFNRLPGESIWIGQQLTIPLLGNTPLPTDFIPDPSAISFSVEDEPEAVADALNYDDFETVNAGFNFAAGLEE